MKSLQTIGYTLLLALWLGALLLAVLVPWPWLLLVLALVHVAELLAVGYRTGRRDGNGSVWCIIMCMLFGLVWWLPIKRRLDPGY